MALFPIITNQINTIYQLRNTDPAAAASQLMTLEQLLSIQKENIYDYIPKNEYDSIIRMQPPQNLPDNGPGVDIAKLYKDAPADVQRQIEQAAGLQSSVSNDIPPSTPGTIPPMKRENPMKNVPGVSEDKNLARPKGPDALPRPQSAMGSSMDASIGRAANLPFFPGE